MTTLRGDRRMTRKNVAAGLEMLTPPELPTPLGRYSHLGIAPVSSLVAVAGQVSIDTDGELVGAGDVHAQAVQAYENIRAALGCVGLGMADVWKLNAYVVGGDSIEPFMAARTEFYATYYPDGVYPPITLVAVSRLAFPELLVEIEAIAVLPETEA
jgi:2-iminobutanoate/2-iminopropanoate deaminase